MKVRRPPEVVQISAEELEALVGQLRQREPLSSAQCDRAADVLESYGDLASLLAHYETKIAELGRLVDGFQSERKEKLFPEEQAPPSSSDAASTELPLPADDVRGSETPGISDKSTVKKKRKGHGRIGAAAYTGAKQIKIMHDRLRSGDACPECEHGKVYHRTPRRLVKLRGQAPIGATVYEIDKLRCHACGASFEASVPEQAKGDRFEPSAISTIINFRYDNGFPFHRLKLLQGRVGVPMPVGTQWRKSEAAANQLTPVFDELVRLGARCPLLHHDDTKMTVLSLLPNSRFPEAPGNAAERDPERSGVFTSGIVCVDKAYKIALYITGRQHAGENLADLLSLRPADLDQPIQMCDALSRNMSPEFKTILANCLTHGRRRFVNVRELFPEPVLHVIETLGKVYENDALTRDMDPVERLHYHQKMSGPRMGELRSWMGEQIDNRQVEPNSQLGESFRYMLKHWDKLTRFLQVPGAPLDNNICERSLKKSIRHRKNSLFYRSKNGARVGDLFMSLIQTAVLNGADPIDYIAMLLQHVDEARASPGSWMPWNYRRTLAARGTPASAAS